MKARAATSRKAIDSMVKALATLASILGIFFLSWILFEVARRGVSDGHGDLLSGR